MTIVTSKEAWELARSMAEEYKAKRAAEKKVNEKPPETVDPSPKVEGGVSRQVTEIDYQKHEQTVKEIERKEAEEEWARAAKENSEWCTLDHEHGPHCQRPRHGCSHDHQKEWQIYEKSTEEKIKAADRFRQEGNDAYNKQNYGLAAVHYRKALLQFDYTFPEVGQEEKALNEVKIRTLLNLAACKVHQEEWPEVLTHCRLATEIDPRSVKAYYRMGQAYLATDQFQLAKDVLMSAYDVEPKNPEVLRALRTLKDRQANYAKKTKFVFKEMSKNKEEAERDTTDQDDRLTSEEQKQMYEEQQQDKENEEGDEETEEHKDSPKRPSTPSKARPASPAKGVAPEAKESENDSSDDDALIGMPRPRAAADKAGATRPPSESFMPHVAQEPSEGIRQRRLDSAASSSKDGPGQEETEKEEEDVEDEGAEKLMRTVGKIVVALGVVSVTLGILLVYQLSGN